ncbi:MAG: hypothetical protein KTR31_18925, partial [Myxococcales bacterium]|nr:hypothetical protein [Myxococcales bacterium]
MPLVIGIAGSDANRIDPTGGSDPVLDAFVVRAWDEAIASSSELVAGLYALRVAFEYVVVDASVVALHAVVVEGSRDVRVDRALLGGLRAQEAWCDDEPSLAGGSRALRTDLVLEVPEGVPSRGRSDVAAAFLAAVQGLSLGEGSLPPGRH